MKYAESDYKINIQKINLKNILYIYLYYYIFNNIISDNINKTVTYKIIDFFMRQKAKNNSIFNTSNILSYFSNFY